MKPVPCVTTGDDKVLDKIIACISDIECSGYFSEFIGMTQPEQREKVKQLQGAVIFKLESEMPEVSWKTEHQPTPTNRDSIDIYGEGEEFIVAIELDKPRADQVSKKFVSRTALLKSKKTFYISLCYPGTENMNEEECVKYFRYCAELSSRMGSHYASLIIE